MCLCCCVYNLAGTLDFTGFSACPYLRLPIMVLSDVETRQKLALCSKDGQTFPSAFGHLNPTDQSPMELRIPVQVPGQQSVIPMSWEVCDSKVCVLRKSKAALCLEILAEGKTHRGNPRSRDGNCSTGSDHSSSVSM